MLKNYFKAAYRSLRKNKATSLVNIFGPPVAPTRRWHRVDLRAAYCAMIAHFYHAQRNTAIIRNLEHILERIRTGAVPEVLLKQGELLTNTDG